MFIAMNRFRIAKGRGGEFEEIWRSRDSHLDAIASVLLVMATSGELVRIDAAGPDSEIIETMALSAGPSDMSVDASGQLIVFAQPVPDGVDVLSLVPCPEDVDGDGGVGFGDLLAVLATWGPYDPCPPFLPEDVDEDCAVGFSDLLRVLAAWGLCP